MCVYVNVRTCLCVFVCFCVYFCVEYLCVYVYVNVNKLMNKLYMSAWLLVIDQLAKCYVEDEHTGPDVFP